MRTFRTILIEKSSMPIILNVRLNSAATIAGIISIAYITVIFSYLLILSSLLWTVLLLMFVRFITLIASYQELNCNMDIPRHC